MGESHQNGWELGILPYFWKPASDFWGCTHSWDHRKGCFDVRDSKNLCCIEVRLPKFSPKRVSEWSPFAVFKPQGGPLMLTYLDPYPFGDVQHTGRSVNNPRFEGQSASLERIIPSQKQCQVRSLSFQMVVQRHMLNNRYSHSSMQSLQNIAEMLKPWTFPFFGPLQLWPFTSEKSVLNSFIAAYNHL